MSQPAAPAAGELPPGSLFAQRYRIVALLGRGGMGAVYRADDLKLGQSVALKFLPDALRQDPDRVQRFLAEVRNAREVAHPNVCRVYDVGEEDDRLFLSMEYVDGEDLSVLLRRIGRLPQEKALDIARQLCAGLAALHDRGLLHRDLKPANVMLDGRGRVRLTDFGLAAFAKGLDAREIRSGTPQYMAPEQLAGDEVSARSDVYALGLVLYEVFTGRAAFSADSVEELQSLHQTATPSRLSTHVQDVDPAVDRVIARCLEKDPTRRPATAIAVSSALPGGDPLAAALALGETPSPELVAAAGGRGGLHPGIAIALFAVGLLGLALNLGGGRNRSLPSYYDLDRPAAAYEERARQLIEDVGLDADPVDRMGGFGSHGSALRWHASRDSAVTDWDHLATLRPDAIAYWYRQSPEHLVPRDPTAHVTLTAPAFDTAGMVSLTMETSGRLLSLESVPPESVQSAPSDSLRLEAVWDRLFEAADLDRATFRDTLSTWVPTVHADDRRAWVGPAPFDSTLTLRIEAGSVGALPTTFRVIGPWNGDRRAASTGSGDDAAQLAIVLLVIVVLGGAGTLAARNVMRRRGDLQRAVVLGLAMTAAPVLRWIFALHHVPEPNFFFDRFFSNLGQGLVYGALCFTFYLAVEPFTRRVWPQTLIAWNRFLSGGFSDPMVGRSVLIGFAMLSVAAVNNLVADWMREAAGLPVPTPGSVDWRMLATAGGMFGEIALRVPISFFNGLFFLVLLVLLRMLLRSRWAAYVVFFVLTTAIIGVQNTPLQVGLAVGAILAATWLFVLVRFGLLAFITGFFLQNVFQAYPLTLRFDQMYSGTSMLLLGTAVVVLVASLVSATAGRSLIDERSD